MPMAAQPLQQTREPAGVTLAGAAAPWEWRYPGLQRGQKSQQHLNRKHENGDQQDDKSQ